jgi:SAM-dependent methyltransferase
MSVLTSAEVAGVARAGDARPQRSVAWLLLAASAVAVLAVGLATTMIAFSGLSARPDRLPARFWLWLLVGALTTAASLTIRMLRWTFLLRRSGTRIPLRDACIGYLSGFSLLFVPVFVGEITLRARVQQTRANVPIGITCVVNLWERLLDLSAVALVALVTALVVSGPRRWLVAPALIVIGTFSKTLRAAAVSAAIGLVDWLLGGRAFVAEASGHTERRPDGGDRRGSRPFGGADGLVRHRAWLAALGASVVAWVLPGIALWGSGVIGLVGAQLAYASSTLRGALYLAPGGVRIVGGTLLSVLSGSGAPEAVWIVLGLRLVTAGFATALGVVFAVVHARTCGRPTRSHFDEIADAYDAQIPPAQRASLLARKTTLMAREIERRLAMGPARGLDVGCGQGWYVARMRELGFDVHGIDESARQTALARTHVDDPLVIGEGSVLSIPAAPGAFDFVYCINVLHHLPSIEDQRAAFRELVRVLRPGGLLFVHEINTRNLLFRFYMGYVFPALNSIDEGVERWLLPHRLNRYTDEPLVHTEYFTFFPEFVPAAFLRMFRPLEAMLEASPLRVYSAHYMAVVQKRGADQAI